MGRDIHFHVEQRDAAGWRRAEELDTAPDGTFRCERCRGTCLSDAGDWVHDANSEQRCPPDGTEQGVPPRQSWYGDRNYTLFGALAFGWYTGRHLRFLDRDSPDLIPVAEVRGLPPDVGDEVRSLAEMWDGDGHNHSHLTVGELLGYDWTQATHHAVVARFRPTNKYVTRDLDEARRHEQNWLNRAGGPPRDWFEVTQQHAATEPDHVLLTWTEPLWRNLPPSFFAAVLRMARLAAGELDSVRCVFWFDN